MSQRRQGAPVTDRIVEAVSQRPGCLLEEVVSACPELSWNQVFLEVDRLSREGHIYLSSRGRGRYVLQPAKSGGRDGYVQARQPRPVPTLQPADGTVGEGIR